MLVSNLFLVTYLMISQLTQKVLLGVLQLEVLIRELVAVDALAASAVALGEVTALNHELLLDEGWAEVIRARWSEGGCGRKDMPRG